MSDLARALLDELAEDPAALERLADALAARVDARMTAREHAPGLLSVTAAAKLLGCSPRTVRRRIAAQTLPAVVEHGRVMLRTDELRAYVEGLERSGAPKPSRRKSAPARDYGFLRAQ